MSSSHQIAPEDRIPLFQKLMFSCGQNTDYIATGLMTTVLWMPFFNIGLGLSPIVLGIILMVLLAWNAICDPIMGNLSDNARTRWGRRRPFMFVGAITTALLYPLFWHFPESVRDGTSWLAHAADWIPYINKLGLSQIEEATALYLIIVGLAFFASFTMWAMPYYGMQLELTPDYDERTRLTACMTLVAKLTSLVSSWIFAVIIFVGMAAQGDPKAMEGKPEFLREIITAVHPWLSSFAGAHLGEKPIVPGMRVMCWVIAGFILVLGLLPALFVKERYYAKEASKQSREPFWQSIRESLKCKPLWSLIMVSFFLVLGYTAIGGLGQYVNIYYVCKGDLAMSATITGMKGTVLAVSGILMLPFFTWLGEKYDKRTVVIAMLSSSMLGHLLNLFLMTPEHPYWQIIPGIFESSAIGAVWMFLPSMKADVADWDELHTTRRREGAINSFYSWFIKASLTCSMGIGGVVLQVTGFDVKASAQAPEVLSRMLIIFVVLPLIIWSVAVVSLWFYPLTRKRCAEIRATLEARRGAI